MTSTGNHDAEIPEADEADRAWQDRPVDEDASEQPASTVPPVGWEANEADLQEQLESIDPDEDDEYPHGEAEEP